MGYATPEDRDQIEAVGPWKDRDIPVTVWQQIERTAGRFPHRPAVTYQLFSGPKDKAETLTWTELKDQVAQAANLFRELGVGPEDRVAYLLPNCNECIVTYLGGMVAGVVNPINPLLEAGQIAAILRETNAKVLVTLRAFPKTDVAQKAAEAVAHAPNVEHVLEVDLHRYLTGAKKLIVSLIRPKVKVTHKARVQNFNKAIAAQPKALQFNDPAVDRICTNFHTGGTTGMPKVAQHTYSGIIYNGWLGSELLFTEEDNLICPLPLFHVFAAVVVMGSSIASGAHVVFPTPAGYRGEGVFDNFWKLCERYGITFMITVPTAVSALMQRKVDADISSLRIAFCGSSPLPVELYKRFETAAGVTICEGYGLTEATCLVAINPPAGTKKIGSVGLPFPYTDVKIFHDTEDGGKECPTDVVGEICVSSPGVFVGNTYSEEAKNRDLYHGDYLRTGDLGRIDPDGYIWITGRAKDLIIRGGHNIDPAEIEEALAAHEEVAMAGAIGQPDAHAGELPCAYVELCQGATATEEDLIAFAKSRINERAAWPKRIELMDELPKTAVGKVFKPDLRRMAITRVYNDALRDAGLDAQVVAVIEDKKRGLVAQVSKVAGTDEAAVARVLGSFTRPWEWAEH
ncbi:fatty-acyl-CoA synthase [Palleronia marisminoris]|uniref:Long-chain-fatty-acid--CoA ligase n=1 Tax=Palleronia marisminoris TaxID=315423 RepID=A0A1Y5TG71_9RHOB|nr:acyl-CoA synthetase [Palleronia marisminoris]SFH38380.1 fatty-acyl-CoA synthase [Palleronia marisminoris]SLN63354.1 Long-chain-fatty-acid--CoA ligase [Palleronia marisminoris]